MSKNKNKNFKNKNKNKFPNLDIKNMKVKKFSNSNNKFQKEKINLNNEPIEKNKLINFISKQRKLINNNNININNIKNKNNEKICNSENQVYRIIPLFNKRKLTETEINLTLNHTNPSHSPKIIGSKQNTNNLITNHAQCSPIKLNINLLNIPNSKEKNCKDKKNKIKVIQI
jgi:hypothetical protein